MTTRIDITAADLGRRDNMPVTVADLLPELRNSWTTPTGCAPDCYAMEYYFPGLDLHEVYDRREQAVQAMRDSYIGADSNGIGLDLTDLGPGLVQ